MTFFLHRGGFPKAECVARDGTGAGVCLFWFPEQPIFTFLSSHTEESCGPAHPALAGLVLHMREDLPLDSYIVICWHLPLDPHFPKMKKYRVTRSKQVEFLDQSPLSLSLSLFFFGEHSPSSFGRSLVAPCPTIGEHVIAKQGWEVKQTWHFCICLRNSIPDGYMRDPRPKIQKLAHGAMRDHLKKIILFVWRYHEGYMVSVWGLDHPHLLSHLMIYVFMT